MVGLFFLIRCNFNNVYTSTQSFFELRNGQFLFPILRSKLNYFFVFQNGFASGIPFLLAYIVFVVGGQVADWLRYTEILTTEQVRKVCVTAGESLAYMVHSGYMLHKHRPVYPLSLDLYQGHPTDSFGRISVRKTCQMSSRAFLIKIN